MATPQGSITTVNGRRCTRSRARTAATSNLTTEEPAVVTPTEVTTSTAAAQAPQVQTSAAEAPPPPPPPPAAPPSSTAPAEQPAAPATTPSASSSAIGTISAVPIPPAQTTPLVNVAPSEPAPAAPKGPAEASRPAAVPSQAAVVTTAAPTTPATPSSDTNSTAVPSPSRIPSSLPAPFFTAPAASDALRTSLQAAPEQPGQTDTPSEPSFADTPGTRQPQPTTNTAPPFASDGAAGIIAPDQSSDPEGGLTIPNTGDANIGSIIGGVIGGVAGLALVCALLFFCLRKRKSRQSRWNEKRLEGPGFMEKMRAIPTGVGVFLAKLKGKKAGPSRNPYQRHSQQDSISSIYSTASNGRARSISEPQGFFAVGAPAKRSSSRKSERNLLRKKNSSVSSQSTFVGILEEREKDNTNPFADPEPPRTLLLINPDAPQPPSGPATPQPAAISAGVARNPFATPFDDIADAPPLSGHKRTQSSASALSSHPPTFFYPSAELAFNRKPIGPPPSNPAPLPNQKRRSPIAYPSFNVTSTSASRASDHTLFGEPGSSRPGTNMFTPGMPTGRTVRQSDPFDLDRPEVLGFGNVAGRKEVRESVTRQATRGKRTSSVGNWVSAAEGSHGAYERYSVRADTRR